MRKEFDEPSAEEPRPGILDRLRVALDAARALASIRGEIFRGELAEGAALAARGAAAFLIALVLAGFAVLLLTALAVALFALLFGSVWAGILATLVLFLAGAGAAAYIGVRMFGKVRFDFPATRDGLSEDVASVRAALQPPDPDAGEAADAEDAEDIEKRFRSGSE